MVAPEPLIPSPVTRALGVLGMVGGLSLLAAFVVDIPPAVNSLRIVLFSAGTIAIGVAAHPPQAAVSRQLALTGVVTLVLANAWSLGWFLLGTGRERPFAGDFGLVGFYAGLAVWLADAWYGLIAVRIGVLWRPTAIVLAVGSLLAITGMDRLELTTQADPTLFGPLSLLGIALNGLAWVLLGIQLSLAGHTFAGARPVSPDAAGGPEGSPTLP